jgi:hypothetical protein
MRRLVLLLSACLASLGATASRASALTLPSGRGGSQPAPAVNELSDGRWLWDFLNPWVQPGAAQAPFTSGAGHDSGPIDSTPTPPGEERGPERPNRDRPILHLPPATDSGAGGAGNSGERPSSSHTPLLTQQDAQDREAGGRIVPEEIVVDLQDHAPGVFRPPR